MSFEIYIIIPIYHNSNTSNNVTHTRDRGINLTTKLKYTRDSLMHLA